MLSEIKVELDSKPRLQIIQGMWFEILSKKPASQVIPIIQYLAYTEQESSLSGYYQALAVAIGVPDSIEEETERWPEVSKLTPVKVGDSTARFF